MTRRKTTPPTPARNLTPEMLYRLRVEVAVVIICTTQDMAKQYAFEAADRLLSAGVYPESDLVGIMKAARRYESLQQTALSGGRKTPGRFLPVLAEMNDRYDEQTAGIRDRLTRDVERVLRSKACVRPDEMARLYTAAILLRQTERVRADLFAQMRNTAPAMWVAVQRIAGFSVTELSLAAERALDACRPWNHGIEINPDAVGLGERIADCFAPYVDADTICDIFLRHGLG